MGNANAGDSSVRHGSIGSSSSQGEGDTRQKSDTGNMTTPLLSRAKKELMEIVVDKSVNYRTKWLGELGESIKQIALDDPDMWPIVHKGLRSILDHLWSDIEHEIERGITSAVHEQTNYDEVPGPKGRCLLAIWYKVRAYVLNRYLPHNKTIFGKLKDPFTVLLYILTFLPIHGVRVIFFGILLLMLVFPGKPDEFQLINFILLFKGFQFMTSGILVMASGAFSYYSCYTFHKDDFLKCVDTTGPAPSSVGGVSGLLIDYAGSIILVWIAFAALSRSVNSVQELQQQQVDQMRAETPEESYRRLRLERALQTEGARGGRLWNMLRWDMKCFLFSIFLLVSSAIFTCQEHFEHGGVWYTLLENPQFRANVFWCCDVYAVLSLPFAFFLIPGFLEIMTHSDTTGYNKHGACVLYKMPRSSKTVVQEEVEEAEEDPKKRKEKPDRWDKAANLAVKVVRTIEKGQQARGADAQAPYQFGDWTRGMIAGFKQKMKEPEEKANEEERGKSFGDYTRNLFKRNKSEDLAKPEDIQSFTPDGQDASFSPTTPANATERRGSSMGSISSWNGSTMFQPSKRPSRVDTLYEEPFHVASVRITKVEEGQKGTPTYFFIEVSPYATFGESADPWEVKHRFSEFHELHQKLGEASNFPDAPFPSRNPFMKFSSDGIEGRRTALELWLSRAITSELVKDKWAEPLRDFLSPPTSWKSVEAEPSSQAASSSSRPAIVDALPEGPDESSQGVTDKGHELKNSSEVHTSLQKDIIEESIVDTSNGGTPINSEVRINVADASPHVEPTTKANDEASSSAAAHAHLQTVEPGDQVASQVMEDGAHCGPPPTDTLPREHDVSGGDLSPSTQHSIVRIVSD